MNIYKELKSKYKFHFDLPDFVKDFLHEISLKRTFKNKMDERLESVNEEHKESLFKKVTLDNVVLLEVHFENEEFSLETPKSTNVEYLLVYGIQM